ncbi:MAG: hypothetical protein GY820_15140 [Gammaproteobacteria bacterium]|nr:hypothetical protein [Gammaproteobacteria bacterium]
MAKVITSIDKADLKKDQVQALRQATKKILQLAETSAFKNSGQKISRQQLYDRK